MATLEKEEGSEDPLTNFHPSATPATNLVFLSHISNPFLLALPQPLRA